MNYPELKSAIKHLQQTCKCGSCNKRFREQDVCIIATTGKEGLFELKCRCKTSTIVTVTLEDPKKKTIDINQEQIAHRDHQSISKDDVLDTKNFLRSFDGDFKKIFITKEGE